MVCNNPHQDSKHKQNCWQAMTMASDSESSQAGTLSEGLSPIPGLQTAMPSQRPAKVSMGGMLSPSLMRRKTSIKSAMPGIMKRAISSPNVRDLANLDTSTMSSAEKKRNKLGYHRTAVACGKILTNSIYSFPDSKPRSTLQKAQDSMYYSSR